MENLLFNSLFTLDGPAQVRVTPDDGRCIAAEVIAAGNGGPARLSAEVYSAMRRPVAMTRRGKPAHWESTGTVSQ